MLAYSVEVIMMAMIAANVEETKAQAVLSLLSEAEEHLIVSQNSKNHKRDLLSAGSYEQMERKANEFSE